jgi:hypothetical protein
MDLLTTNEILRLNPVFRNTSMSNFCTNITAVEYDCFSNCFGLELRDEMILDKIFHPNLKTFQENTSYGLGESVIFMNTIYVSSIADNNSSLNTDNWTISKYFNNIKFENLWNVGLGKYLSLKVIIEALPYVAYQIEGKGIGKIYEDSGFRTAEKSEYYMILKSMEHTANLSLRAAKKFYELNFVVNTNCEGKDFCEEEEDSRIAW